MRPLVEDAPPTIEGEAVLVRDDAAAPAETVQRGTRRFRLVGPSTTPPGAVVWLKHMDRRSVLVAWQTGVMNELGPSGRVVRLGWALEGLFRLDGGYANPSDSFLARRTGMHLSHVAEGLRILEAKGAIVRGHVRISASATERRIWPAQAIVDRWSQPSKSDGRATIRIGTNRPSDLDGQKKNGDGAHAREGGSATRESRGYAGRPTYSVAMARADAEARDRARREHP